MTDPHMVILYCNNCKKDVTEECLNRLDTEDLPDPLVSYRSCPHCHQITGIKATIKGYDWV